MEEVGTGGSFLEKSCVGTRTSRIKFKKKTNKIVPKSPIHTHSCQNIIFKNLSLVHTTRHLHHHFFFFFLPPPFFLPPFFFFFFFLVGSISLFLKYNSFIRACNTAFDSFFSTIFFFDLK